MRATGSTSRLLKAATEIRKAVGVLARKGPGPFLAESHLRLQMHFARQFVHADGCRFDSTLLPPAVVREILRGKYEINERQALSWIDPSLPLVECGAGLGIVACLANRRLKNPTHHVLVEANPALLPVLARHRALNGCQFEVPELRRGIRSRDYGVFRLQEPAGQQPRAPLTSEDRSPHGHAERAPQTLRVRDGDLRY